MRAKLTGREFAKLVTWCEIPPGKHSKGGIQDRRAKWLAQLTARGVTGKAVRAGSVSADDRYIDLDDADIEVIRTLRATPGKGTWQRDMQAIFGGITLP